MSNYLQASQGDLELEKALGGLSMLGNSIPATNGNVYYVIPAADSSYATFYKKYQKKYSDGTFAVHNTIASAYSAVTDNRNDIILLSANAAHAQTSMITVSKNRVHFVGFGLRGGAMGIGARARVTMAATGVATDIAILKNTGVGNTFRNIKFDSSSTTAESLYGVIDAGEYAIWENCEFFKSSDLDTTGSAELVCNADSSQYIRCTFGSDAATSVGAIIRACVLFTKEIGGTGKTALDCIFEECIFLKKAGNVADRLVYAAADADIPRMILFKDCFFFNTKNAAALPAQAIGTGANLTAGAIVVINPAFFNCTKLSTSVGVMVIGAATGATAGLATQAA